MPAFQPEAERYYAEGFWRSGDLWTDVAERADEHPDRVAMVLGDREVRYDALIRAAVGVSQRLADSAVEPGDVVILLGRHSIEAVVAMLGCLHRGVVLAPLPPMFNETQLSALVEQTAAKAILAFGGDKEIAKCRTVEDRVSVLLELRPEDVEAAAADDRPATARRATPTPSPSSCTRRGPRRRRRASPTRATRCGTRPRASAAGGV